MSKAPRSRLSAAIAERLDTTKSVAELGREVAAYLLQEGRVNELESVLRDIMQLRANAGVVEVIATSAHDLDTAAEAEIKAAIKQHYPAAKHIIISHEYDPSVIGGVRLTLANEQLDLTVRSKLNRFKQLTAVGKE